MKRFISVLVICTNIFLMESIEAKVKLPSIFSDNMVLQQQSEVPVWGESSSKRTVTITTSWNKKVYNVIPDAAGKWKTTLSTPVYGGPYSIEINDGTKLIIKNVLIGEVWLCSGQSNMEMPVNGWGKIKNYEKEMAAANYPNIRFLKVKRSLSPKPMNDVEVESGSWQICSPETVGDFSAVSYFFGKNLFQNKDIPVGLINSSWGGTVAEAWTSKETLKTMPDFCSQVEDIERTASAWTDIEKKYNQEYATWLAQVNNVDKGIADGKALWANADLSESGWATIKIPNYWEKQGLVGFDGMVWLRKTIDIPAGWQNKDLKLNLDIIDDNDITYFNGVEIGRTQGWNISRIYTVPAKLVKNGKAVITVRVLDNGGGGGLYGDSARIGLSLSFNEKISLTGDWLYKIGFDIKDISGAPKKWDDPNRATVLYNAMINPIVPFAIKGAIWYQGESNADKAYQYRELFPLMIKDWRKRWNSNFPFYFVQLANYTDTLSEPQEALWAELREAQLKTLNLENTGMAVSIDLGEAKDIHPKNKQDVGYRLALVARNKTYGENIPFSGPVYDSYEIKGDSVLVRFKHTEGGLKSLNGEPLKGFSIAGLDHKFHWADAKIIGNDILVYCKEISNPMAVRYAWAANPICNLYNGAGFPASPFRTDDWLGLTYGRK